MSVPKCHKWKLKLDESYVNSVYWRRQSWQEYPHVVIIAHTQHAHQAQMILLLPVSELFTLDKQGPVFIHAHELQRRVITLVGNVGAKPCVPNELQNLVSGEEVRVVPETVCVTG